MILVVLVRLVVPIVLVVLTVLVVVVVVVVVLSLAWHVVDSSARTRGPTVTTEPNQHKQKPATINQTNHKTPNTTLIRLRRSELIVCTATPLNNYLGYLSSLSVKGQQAGTKIRKHNTEQRSQKNPYWKAHHSSPQPSMQLVPHLLQFSRAVQHVK